MQPSYSSYCIQNLPTLAVVYSQPIFALAIHQLLYSVSCYCLLCCPRRYIFPCWLPVLGHKLVDYIGCILYGGRSCIGSTGTPRRRRRCRRLRRHQDRRTRNVYIRGERWQQLVGGATVVARNRQSESYSQKKWGPSSAPEENENATLDLCIYTSIQHARLLFYPGVSIYIMLHLQEGSSREESRRREENKRRRRQQQQRQRRETKDGMKEQQRMA